MRFTGERTATAGARRGSPRLVSLFAEHIDSLEDPIPVAVETQRLKGASFVEALLPTMFSSTVPPEDVSASEASMRDSIRPASVPWRARQTRTYVACFRRSMYRRS